jgi:hypothetical protein
VDENSDVVAPPESARPRELLTSKYPALNGGICIILATAFVGASADFFWLSRSASALVGPGVASLLLAVLSVLIAILALRLARRPSTGSSLPGRLRLFGILAFVVGTAGAACGLVFGGVTGSIPAVGAGVGVLIVSIVVAAQAAAVYGAATQPT